MLEAEPVDDPYGRGVLSQPDAPTAPVEDQPSDGSSGAPPEALPETVAPPAPDTPAPTTAPPGEPRLTGVEIVPGPEPEIPAADLPGARGRKAHAPAKRGRVKRSPAALQVAEMPAVTVAGAQTPQATHIAPPARHAPPGAPRFHVVRPRESLWSIAHVLLGSAASTGAIASEVARLWLLNERQIGTGNPDLLPVGVKLTLREAA